MKISILSIMTLLVSFCVVPTIAQDTADLKIRFEYGGDPPEPTAVDVNKDVEFCGRNKLMNERLLVNRENKGIKNVVVYVYTGRGGSKLDPVAPAENTKILANAKCRFEPRIVVAQTGDTLKVTNEDEVGHNAKIDFFNNNPVNPMIAPGNDVQVVLKESEPGPIPVSCSIHPWMSARVVVFDHPYAAVSDDNGELMIKGLPAGKKLVFRANHEAGRISDVTINGKNEQWRASRFELDIKPGLNDLGTVVIPADSLSAQ